MRDPCHLPSEAIEPFEPFAAWYADAQAAEPRDANAMALATVDEEGLPNLRIVLMKSFDRSGFVFYTNFNSPKGRELHAQRRAALNFYWKSLGRQVRLRGLVSAVGEAEADEYFATRPREAQIGAWASDQSAPIESRAVLELKIGEIERRFSGGDVPRPAHWSGFRAVPLSVEFWQERPFRLHDRIQFARRAPHETEWRRCRLSP